jgi:regulator of sigma E protease
LIKNKWVILNPIKNSIAEKVWIKPWDILLKINSKKVNTPEELINIFQKNKNKTVKLKISRFLKRWHIRRYIINIKLNSKWKIWAYVWENIKINKDFTYEYWIIDSINYWVQETYIQSVLTLKWIWILWQKIFSPKTEKERSEALNQMSWPIWIVDFVSHSLWAWIVFLSIITAIISINLWIFNLLPIPALDWWRFFLLTINTILKKIFWEKVKLDNFENLIHIIFFIILIVLSVLIWYNDIEKIINR